MLRLILEIHDSDTGYEGVGSLQEPWWRQPVARKQLIVMLEDILAAARERCWGSGRRGKGGGGREVAESNAGSNGIMYDETETGDSGVGKLSCFETLRQEKERGKGSERLSPWADIGWRVGKGWSRLKKNSNVKISNRSSVLRDSCPMLEHHHLIIWTHLTDRYP